MCYIRYPIDSSVFFLAFDIEVSYCSIMSMHVEGVLVAFRIISWCFNILDYRTCV